MHRLTATDTPMVRYTRTIFPSYAIIKEDILMSNIYFTVTGLHHYYGDSFLEKEMIVYLKKEKDNEYDKEAISVNLPGLGKIGYVANSPYTVLGESYSAGRLYDKMSEEASGKVKFILDKGVICELIE